MSLMCICGLGVAGAIECDKASNIYIIQAYIQCLRIMQAHALWLLVTVPANSGISVGLGYMPCRNLCLFAKLENNVCCATNSCHQVFAQFAYHICVTCERKQWIWSGLGPFYLTRHMMIMSHDIMNAICTVICSYVLSN